jgi:hypothetical protein
MNIKELNRKKVPIVKIDESLNKYNEVVLFPDKLKKANEMLKTVGIPEFNVGISTSRLSKK